MSYIVTTNIPYFEFTALKASCPEARVRILKVNLRNQSTEADQIVTIGTAEMIGDRFISLLPVTKSDDDRCAEGEHEYIFAGVISLQPLPDKPVQTCVISLCTKCHSTIITVA